MFSARLSWLVIKLQSHSGMWNDTNTLKSWLLSSPWPHLPEGCEHSWGPEEALLPHAAPVPRSAQCWCGHPASLEHPLPSYSWLRGLDGP